MFIEDYHMHCRWSEDARIPMVEMAQACVKRGLNEVCFTDHVEVMISGIMEHNQFDWPALLREYEEARAAVGDRLTIRMGVELGEVPRDFAYTEKLLAEMPKMDFSIGSIHQLSGAYGFEDLKYVAADEDSKAPAQIRDYLEVVLKLAKWGKFSVLGHLTLPLRYMNEVRGIHATFDGFEAEVEEIFRTLIQNGCGIEINTNRGHQPLPDMKWLKLYRSLGGEIITMGSDAHSPDFVGCAMEANQKVLKECGFNAICTFEQGKPIFHDIVL